MVTFGCSSQNCARKYFDVQKKSKKNAQAFYPAIPEKENLISCALLFINFSHVTFALGACQK